MNYSYDDKNRGNIHYLEPPIPVAPIPPISPQRRVEQNWCEMQQKNKPQSNSVAGAIILMLVSGLHVGWGIFSPGLSKQEWYMNVPRGEALITVMSWYIAAVIGSGVTLIILPRYEKKPIYYAGCCLCIISSALFIAFPQNVIALLVGRLLAGFAHGFVYITGIIHASENVIKEIRGLLLASMHFCLISSAFTAAIFVEIGTAADFDGNRYIGIFGIVYSVMALLFVPFLTYESVVFLIQRQRYNDALMTMIKLRNESVETWEIKNDFDEMKLMVAEDVRTSCNIVEDGNKRPLILICIVKILFALSFNYAVNMIRIGAITNEVSSYNMNFASIVLLGSRMTVATIFLFFMDIMGRKLILAISAGGSAFCLLFYGVIYSAHYTPFWLVGALIISFDILSGVGIGAIPDILSSEAFPITKKTASIGLASCLDYCIQITLLSTTFELDSRTFIYSIVFSFAGLMIGGTIYLNRNLPETRVMSLRQARNEFRRVDDMIYSGGRMPQGITYS